MKISIGIVGLPNVGKSTLFKILTEKEVNIANYPFATIDPNVGVVAMPDKRLEKVAEVIGSKKVLPATFEFFDIAGLVRGAHEGRGLGNQFLAHIREVDAIIHLVRIFEDEEIIHFEGKSEPLRDFETILEELRAKDDESMVQQAHHKENLLSVKPQLVILNGEPQEAGEDLKSKLRALNFPYLILNLKRGFSETELGRIFKSFLATLNLIVFFTANENEARSWFVKDNTKAPQAAGVIHTDFEKKFIKAEVVSYDDFVKCGGWSGAREKGRLRLEGRDYVVQDGDVVVVRHG